MAEYQAHFLNTGEWWIAWTDDVPGALTQGKTLEEARENLKDAVTMMMEPAPYPLQGGDTAQRDSRRY